MKKLALLLSLVVAGSAAHLAAEEASAAKPAEAVKPADAKASHASRAASKLAGKTHEVPAEVVSVDTAKSTITIKGEAENKTVPVDAKATASLTDLKAGDKVTLTCWDDAKGDHKKVVGIVPVKM